MQYRRRVVRRRELRPSPSFIKQEQEQVPQAHDDNLAFSLTVNEDGSADPPLTYDELNALEDVYNMSIPCEVERETVPIYPTLKTPIDSSASYEVVRRSDKARKVLGACLFGYEDYLPRKKTVKTTARTKVSSFTGRSTIDLVRVKSRCLPPKYQYSTPDSSSASSYSSASSSSYPSPPPSPPMPRSRSPSPPPAPRARRVEICPKRPSGPSPRPSPRPVTGPKPPSPSPPMRRITYHPPADPPVRRISYQLPNESPKDYPEITPIHPTTAPKPSSGLAPRSSKSPERPLSKSASRSPSRSPSTTRTPRTISRPASKTYSRPIPRSPSTSPVRAARSVPEVQDKPRPRSISPPAKSAPTPPRAVSPAPSKASSKRSISPTVKVPMKKVTFAEPLMSGGRTYDRKPLTTPRQPSPHPVKSRAATVEYATDEDS